MPRPALAADRAIQVFDLMTMHPNERFSLTEIARRTRINPASVHSLLAVLVRAGYVQRHRSHKTYGLGPAMAASGSVALEQLPGIRFALAEMDTLSLDLQLETFVTSASDDEIIVVGRSSHASQYGTVLTVGQRLPLAPPVGSVFLAWSSADEIDRWLQRAQPSPTAERIEQYREIFASVRERGYSVILESQARRGLARELARQHAKDTPGDSDDIASLLTELSHTPFQAMNLGDDQGHGIGMIAAPIFDASGNVTAAIAASGFAPTVSTAELLRVGEKLQGAALVITKRTLGRVPLG